MASYASGSSDTGPRYNMDLGINVQVRTRSMEILPAVYFSHEAYCPHFC